MDQEHAFCHRALLFLLRENGPEASLPEASLPVVYYPRRTHGLERGESLRYTAGTQRLTLKAQQKAQEPQPTSTSFLILLSP